MPESPHRTAARAHALEIATAQLRAARSRFALSVRALHAAFTNLPADSDEFTATNRRRVRGALQQAADEIRKSDNDAEAFEIILQGLADE